jgi:acyl-CoA thioesterase-2
MAHDVSKLQPMTSSRGTTSDLSPVNAMLAALTLSSTSARTREDIFTAPSQWQPHGRVFGGQVMAQAALGAMHTIDPERIIHSLHGYFLRPGDVEEEITLSVDRIHDGRSFSTRRVQAYQKGQPIFSMIASFQDENPGLDHHARMPDGIPDPETLPSAAEVLQKINHPAADIWAKTRAFDLRHHPSPVYVGVDGETHAHQAVWMRALERLPDDANLHRAALAYASDFSILEPVMRAHGVSWATPGLKIASLDHAMWWHRFHRADDWFLYSQESPSARGGRGLSVGRIFSQDGVLVASVAQEGMVRVPSPS